MLIGLKPHTCDVCQKSFTQRSTMKKHLKNVHRDKNREKTQLNKTERVVQLSKQPEGRTAFTTGTNSKISSLIAPDVQVPSVSVQPSDIMIHESASVYSNQRQVTVPAADTNLEMINPQNCQEEVEGTHSLNTQSVSSALERQVQPNSYRSHQSLEMIPKYSLSMNDDITGNHTVSHSANNMTSLASYGNDGHLSHNAGTVSEQMDANKMTLISQLMEADATQPKVLLPTSIQKEHPFLANIISSSEMPTSTNNSTVPNSSGELSSNPVVDNAENPAVPSSQCDKEMVSMQDHENFSNVICTSTIDATTLINSGEVTLRQLMQQ